MKRIKIELISTIMRNMVWNDLFDITYGSLDQHSWMLVDELVWESVGASVRDSVRVNIKV